MTQLQKFAVCGAGFIGKNLVNELVRNNCNVNVLDRNTCPEEFKDQVNWITGEFSDQSNLAETLSGVEVAFHLVSSTVPGDESIDPIKELSENIFSTIKFLDTCKQQEVKRVVFVSSSSVYGLQETMPIPEGVVTNPISSHGIQKLTIEKYLLLYQFLHGLDVRIVRLSNPFGPGQSLFGRQGFIAMAIGKMINNQPILLRDSGKPVRDFIFIDDVSHALFLAGTKGKTTSVINIGSGVGYSLVEVVRLFEEVTGKSILSELGELRKVDIPVSVLDVSLAHEQLGFQPKFTMREGLIQTFRHHGIETLRI